MPTKPWNFSHLVHLVQPMQRFKDLIQKPQLIQDYNLSQIFLGRLDDPKGYEYIKQVLKQSNFQWVSRVGCQLLWILGSVRRGFLNETSTI